MLNGRLTIGLLNEQKDTHDSLMADAICMRKGATGVVVVDGMINDKVSSRPCLIQWPEVRI